MIGMQHFTLLYDRARRKAINSRNIISGWSKKRKSAGCLQTCYHESDEIASSAPIESPQSKISETTIG